MDDIKYMRAALKEADKALAKGEVPIGAVIVDRDGRIVARAHNLKRSSGVATHHAEVLAIEKANKKRGDWRLDDCDIFVTLEPCPMCAGAIIQARLRRVVFGAYDPKGGSIVSCQRMYETKGYNHYPLVTEGLMEEECSAILTKFFKEMRDNSKKSCEI